MAPEYLYFCLYTSRNYFGYCQRTPRGPRSVIPEHISENHLVMSIENDKDENDYLADVKCVFDDVITHNLKEMAEQVGVHKCLWEIETTPFTTAADIQPAIGAGITQLAIHPDLYKTFNHVSGYGTYEHLLEFLTRLNDVCLTYPDAWIGSSK